MKKSLIPIFLIQVAVLCTACGGGSPEQDEADQELNTREHMPDPVPGVPGNPASNPRWTLPG
jgi:hypothetical protein